MIDEAESSYGYDSCSYHWCVQSSAHDAGERLFDHAVSVADLH